MISVVTPHYNSSETIIRLIPIMESIAKESKDFEWVIVDDNSKSEHVSRLDSLSIEYSFMKLKKLTVNKGPHNARAVGSLNANNELICLLDSDDYIDVEMFLKTVRHITKYLKEYSFFYHSPQLLSIEKYESYKFNEQIECDSDVFIQSPSDFIKYKLPSMSSIIIKKEFFKKINSLNFNHLEWAEDILLYLFLSKYGKGVFLKRTYSIYIFNPLGRGSQVFLKHRIKLSLALFINAVKGPKKIGSILYATFFSIRYYISYVVRKLNLIKYD